MTANGDARDLALRALVMKCIADLTATAIKQRRNDLAETLGSGDRVTVRSPDGDGAEVGMVYRTKPHGTATVTDRARFTGWMREQYPDRVHTDAAVAAGDMGEVIQVLKRHAPYLVREEWVVMPWAEHEVLELTKKARRACGPGGEVDVPGVVWEPPGDGVVTVRLSPEGPGVIRRLWREGRIDVESGTVLAISQGTDFEEP